MANIDSRPNRMTPFSLDPNVFAIELTAALVTPALFAYSASERLQAANEIIRAIGVFGLVKFASTIARTMPSRKYASLPNLYTMDDWANSFSWSRAHWQR